MERDPNNPDPSATTDNSPPSPNSPNPQIPDSQSPQTPPTNQLPAQATKSKYEELLEATLREQNARIQSLVAERQQPPPPPSEPPRSDPAAFFNDPQGELAKFRKQINEDLNNAIAPLKQLAQGFKGEGTPYGNLKNQFMNDPRFSQVLSDPKVSVAVDKIMEGQNLHPDTMRMAIQQAAGMKATGELDVALVASGVDVSRYNSPPPAPPPVTTIPPHMRPTSPAAPIHQQPTTSVTPLSELEKRVARERGMSEDQYREWLTLPPDKVATSQIGRTPK